MCGIAGSFRCDVDVDAMLDRISHRGPDGRGTCRSKDLLLGHVRLAIQDTSDSASQPFRYGDVLLAYNGEAWNPEELRREWNATVDSPEWTTSSDTEPIARLLDQVGISCLRLIDGMFAMAWESRDGAWLARDRYGKIPLYYAEYQGGYVFASELKAFDLAWGVRPKAVPPGSAVRLATGEIVRWDGGMPAEPCTPENVLRLLDDGVRKRMISDRPVCFLLSGGLDSSLVLALGKKYHPNPVAYTAVFDDQSADLAMARRVAQELEVPLVEVKVPRPTYAAIEDAVAAVEVPMKAQVEIALAHLPLMRAIASDGYRVALSGEAADEIFCGYGNMALRASQRPGDAGYRSVLQAAVDKMSRGNFMRVNKVMMSAGVEGRLPFMEEGLVAMALAANKADNPPGKRVLKEAALSVLPAYVVKRQKETFQGGTGITAAALELMDSPVRYYNAEARRLFGFLPKE